MNFWRYKIMRIAERAMEIINEAVEENVVFDGVTQYVVQKDEEIIEVGCWGEYMDMMREYYNANGGYLKKLNKILKVKGKFRVLPKGTQGTLEKDADDELVFNVDGVFIPFDGYGVKALNRLFKRA